MQETSDIVATRCWRTMRSGRAGGPERARDAGTSNEVTVRPSLLPAEYTPMSEPAGGVVLLRVRAVRRGQREVCGERQATGAEAAERWSGGFREGPGHVLVEKLWVLEEHLGKHAYCCGDAPGLDDIMRFVVLQILFVNLGELWGIDGAGVARLPHVARWMGDMGAKASNPFRYVHDNEMYYRAHREWWTRRCRSACSLRWRRRPLGCGSGLSFPRHVGGECLAGTPRTHAPWCCASRAGETPDGLPSVEPTTGLRCTWWVWGARSSILETAL